MRKVLGVLLGIFIFLFVLVGALIVMFAMLPQSAVAPSPSAQLDPLPPEAAQPGNLDLIDAGSQVLAALKTGDWATLSLLVDPELGLTFTPFSTVTPESDRNFTAAQVAAFGADTAVYLWGTNSAMGAPIELTVADYFAQYVWNADYTTAPIIGVNHVNAAGNALENVAEVYADCEFVEYYFPSIDPSNQGFDWCALKLVFRSHEGGGYRLLGVIHSRWMP